MRALDDSQAVRPLHNSRTARRTLLAIVIGPLLATPGVDEPIQVQLTEVKGSIASLQPWVRYAFDNPAFEPLSAGQKIMLCAGAVNEGRLKAQLTAIRQQLIKRVTPR